MSSVSSRVTAHRRPGVACLLKGHKSLRSHIVVMRPIGITGSTTWPSGPRMQAALKPFIHNSGHSANTYLLQLVHSAIISPSELCFSLDYLVSY